MSESKPLLTFSTVKRELDLCGWGGSEPTVNFGLSGMGSLNDVSSVMSASEPSS